MQANDDAFLFGRSYEHFEDLADKWITADIRSDQPGSWLQAAEVEIDMLAALEGILSLYGRISLLFFPDAQSGATACERAQQLRHAINLSDDHPLSNRQLRNHWMHLDHRIDRYVETRHDAPISFLFDIQRRMDVAQLPNVLRAVDPRAEKVYFLGSEFDLKALKSHVAEVYGRTDPVLLGEAPVP